MAPSNSNSDSIADEVSAKPHVIRLHGPWEGSKGGIRNSELETCASNVEQPDRVKVPLDFGQWLAADFRGTVVLERSFKRPTNLDDQQSIFLLVQSDGFSIASASLNGNALTPTTAAQNPSTAADSESASSSESTGTPIRFDVSSALNPVNRLILNGSFDAVPKGKLRLIALEIHE